MVDSVHSLASCIIGTNSLFYCHVETPQSNVVIDLYLDQFDKLVFRL